MNIETYVSIPSEKGKPWKPSHGIIPTAYYIVVLLLFLSPLGVVLWLYRYSVHPNSYIFLLKNIIFYYLCTHTHTRMYKNMHFFFFWKHGSFDNGISFIQSYFNSSSILGNLYQLPRGLTDIIGLNNAWV